MAKRSGPRSSGDNLLARVRELLEGEVADYEQAIAKKPTRGKRGEPRDKRLLVMLAAEARKIDAYERKGLVDYTIDGVVAWATGLSVAERAELVRRLAAINGPRGSGLA
jgi:hypothetical protein